MSPGHPNDGKVGLAAHRCVSNMRPTLTPGPRAGCPPDRVVGWSGQGCPTTPKARDRRGERGPRWQELPRLRQTIPHPRPLSQTIRVVVLTYKGRPQLSKTADGRGEGLDRLVPPGTVRPE